MKLVRHSIYNLLGLGLPLVVAIFSIPILIRELGEARFGLLTLIWAVVSYFGLFDLGLGRALTQQLSVALAREDNKSVGPLVATASSLMAALGVFAGLLMAFTAHWGVGLIQSVPDHQEAVNAVMLMALAMPFIILTAGFRGILEARHAFGIINIIRLPMGLFTFLGPVVVVLYGPIRLDVVAFILILGRIVACIVHAWFAWRILPDDHGRLHFQKLLLRPLCVSGGWLTVSNIISPFMGYVDRFIIGGVITAAAVAYYTTPQEMILRLWIIPGAITAILFPTFAAHITSGDSNVKSLFDRAVNWLFLIMLPITSCIAIFSSEILGLWIGRDFSHESAILMQIFSIGILINCLAHVPFTLIQSANQARITALIHCIQFPFFVVLVWMMTVKYGLIGAVLAWMIRMVVDAALMFLASFHLMGWPYKLIMSKRFLIYSIITIATFMLTQVQDFNVRISIFIVGVFFGLIYIGRKFVGEKYKVTI